MKTIKIKSILSEEDISDNYVVLFNKNGEFCGFINEDTENELFRMTPNYYDDNVYNSLEELLDYYQEGIIKVISIKEMADIMCSLLNTTKDENS